MKVMRSLFRTYIHGSLHVSLALISFVAYTVGLAGVSLSWAYMGFLFFASVAGYNAIKFGAEPWKRETMRHRHSRNIVWISTISAGIASVFVLWLPTETIGLIALGALVAALYALPVLPGFRNFRSFGMIKVPLVVLVWVHLTVWIPLWPYGPFEHWDMILEGLQRAIWVGLLMLPFEIRDMDTDPPTLRTWPRSWGLQATRRIAWMAALVFLLLTFFKDSVHFPEILSKMLAAVFMGWAVQLTVPGTKAGFVSFWVEGVPIWTYLIWRILTAFW